MWIRTKKNASIFHFNIFVSYILYLKYFFLLFRKEIKHFPSSKKVLPHFETNERMMIFGHKAMATLFGKTTNKFDETNSKLSYRRKCLLDLLSHSRQNKKGTSTNWEIKGTIKRNAWLQRKIFCKRKKNRPIVLLMTTNAPFCS